MDKLINKRSFNKLSKSEQALYLVQFSKRANTQMAQIEKRGFKSKAYANAVYFTEYANNGKKRFSQGIKHYENASKTEISATFDTLKKFFNDKTSSSSYLSDQQAKEYLKELYSADNTKENYERALTHRFNRLDKITQKKVNKAINKEVDTRLRDLENSKNAIESEAYKHFLLQCKQRGSKKTVTANQTFKGLTDSEVLKSKIKFLSAKTSTSKGVNKKINAIFKSLKENSGIHIKRQDRVQFLQFLRESTYKNLKGRYDSDQIVEEYAKLMNSKKTNKKELLNHFDKYMNSLYVTEEL